VLGLLRGLGEALEVGNCDGGKRRGELVAAASMAGGGDSAPVMEGTGAFK
jgi:uncharacterized Ntn-hydrolase superfamily protein